MSFPLSQAPYDTPLVVEQIRDEQLSRRFTRLGIAQGDVLTRMNEEAHISPVRVRTPKGEVVLASGMAAKVIIHHDDGHKTPAVEMHPGEEGHVEGLVCGSALERGLGILGIHENDRIGMLRRIPPMDYVALKDGSTRTTLTEGMAAKVWGHVRGRETQFAMAGVGEAFTVTALLGGTRAKASLENLGVAPGVVLTLESVRPALGAGRAAKGQTVLRMASGLRLYLRFDLETCILVRNV